MLKRDQRVKGWGGGLAAQREQSDHGLRFISVSPCIDCLIADVK